jgi:hypothetical protein
MIRRLGGPASGDRRENRAGRSGAGVWTLLLAAALLVPQGGSPSVDRAPAPILVAHVSAPGPAAGPAPGPGGGSGNGGSPAPGPAKHDESNGSKGGGAPAPAHHEAPKSAPDTGSSAGGAPKSTKPAPQTTDSGGTHPAPRPQAPRGGEKDGTARQPPLSGAGPPDTGKVPHQAQVADPGAAPQPAPPPAGKPPVPHSSSNSVTAPNQPPPAGMHPPIGPAPAATEGTCGPAPSACGPAVQPAKITPGATTTADSQPCAAAGTCPKTRPNVQNLADDTTLSIPKPMSPAQAVGALLLGGGGVLAGATVAAAGGVTAETGVGIGVAAVGGGLLVASAHEFGSGWDGLFNTPSPSHLTGPATSYPSTPANPGVTVHSDDRPTGQATGPAPQQSESPSTSGDTPARPPINTPPRGDPGTINDLNPEQASNYKRYTAKLPAKAEDVEVEKLPDDSVRLSARVPANNIPGSYAEYIKVIDKSGNTIQYVKDTYAPDGTVIHSKIK